MKYSVTMKSGLKEFTVFFEDENKLQEWVKTKQIKPEHKDIFDEITILRYDDNNNLQIGYKYIKDGKKE